MLASAWTDQQASRRRYHKLRGKSRALLLVRQRMDDPHWTPQLRLVREPEPPSLPWDGFCPSVLASEKCPQCEGSGVRCTLKRLKSHICPCVYRSIARRCAVRWQIIQMAPETKPRQLRCRYDMPRAEWAADFWMTTRAAVDGTHWLIWRNIRLYNERVDVVQRELRMDRGTFFHALYRAEQVIGHALLWRGLWPAGRYHG